MQSKTERPGQRRTTSSKYRQKLDKLFATSDALAAKYKGESEWLDALEAYVVIFSSILQYIDLIVTDVRRGTLPNNGAGRKLSGEENAGKANGLSAYVLLW